MSGKNKIPYMFATALLLRAAYTFGLPWSPTESEKYINLALSIRTGSFALSGVPETSRPLLLPLIASPFPSVEAFLLVQCFLGSLTCVLMYLIARNCRISTWGVWLFVFAPLTIHYTAAILPETLFTFLTVLAVYFWTANKRIGAGIAFGLASLAGPTILPLLIFAVLVTFLLKQDLKPLLITTAIAVFVALPWMLRNTAIEGSPTLTQKSVYRTNLMRGAISDEELGTPDDGGTIAAYPSCGNESECGQIAVDRIVGQPFGWLATRLEQYPRLFIDTGAFLTSSYPVQFLLICIQVIVGIFAIFGFRDLPLPLWIVPMFLALLYLPLRTEPQYFLSSVPFICLPAGISIKYVFTTYIRKPKPGANKFKRRRSFRRV